MPLGPHFGPFLEPPGLSFGRSWASLGRLLAALGALGRSWGALGPLLGHSCALLGRSWATLARILVLLGASGPLWGRPGEAQDPPDTHFGTILGPSGDGLGTILGGIWEQLQSYLVMLFWDDLGTIWERLWDEFGNNLGIPLNPVIRAPHV